MYAKEVPAWVGYLVDHEPWPENGIKQNKMIK